MSMILLFTMCWYTNVRWTRIQYALCIGSRYLEMFNLILMTDVDLCDA